MAKRDRIDDLARGRTKPQLEVTLGHDPRSITPKRPSNDGSGNPEPHGPPSRSAVAVCTLNSPAITRHRCAGARPVCPRRSSVRPPAQMPASNSARCSSRSDSPAAIAWPPNLSSMPRVSCRDRIQHVAHVHARHRARRTFDPSRVGRCECDHGAVQPLLDPRRDEPDHALVPARIEYADARRLTCLRCRRHAGRRCSSASCCIFASSSRRSVLSAPGVRPALWPQRRRR